MRQLILIVFGFLFFVSDKPAPADVFWLGGNGVWNEPMMWTGIPGGTPGAGPPGQFTDAFFDGITSSFEVNFLGAGTAGSVRIELDGADATFELAGHPLTLRRDFFSRASGAETNQTTVAGGTVTARALSAVAEGLNAVQTVTVEDTAHFTLVSTTVGSPFASQLSAHGSGSLLRIEGSVGMDHTALARADDFGKIIVDNGMLSVGDRMEIDEAASLEVTDRGAASVDNLLQVGIDFFGQVDLNTNSVLFTDGVSTLGVESNGNGNVVIDSHGRWEFRGATTVGSLGQGKITVSGGGQLLGRNAAAHLKLGAGGAASGTLTVGDGVGVQELFESQASVFVGGTESGAGGSGEFLVAPTGRANVDGQIRVWGDGRLEADGGDIQAQQIVVSSGGRLSIDRGGSIEATTVQLDAGANLNGFDDGELIIRGPGGSFSPPTASFGFGAASGLTTIHLDNATTFVTDWTIANFPGAAAKTIVNGQQGRLDASRDLLVTGPHTSNLGTLEVTNGGLAQARHDVVIGFASSSIGHVVVDGSSGGQRSLLRNTAQGGDGEIIIGSNGLATLDVLNGALVQSLNNISIAAFPAADATVHVTGSPSEGTSIVSASNQLFVGGHATTENRGGTGALNINNLGQVLGGQRMKVYEDGSVNLTPGAFLATQQLDTSGSVYNEGVINIGGSSLPTTDGDLVVGPNGALFLFGGHLRTRNATFEAGAVVDLFGGALQIEGGQLELNQTSMAYGSPTGFPITTYELAAGATASIPSFWRIGNDAGTQGRAIVRGAGSRLENTDVGGSADIIAGAAGTGFLDVLDGGTVDFNDDVIAGLSAGSIGSVFVRGVEGSARSTLRAFGSATSDIIIGSAGLGGMDVVDGALVETSGNLFMGLVAGGDGVVTVSGQQNGFVSTVNVAHDLTIGASLTGGTVVNRGAGLMVIAEDGVVGVGGTTLVGPDDLLVLGGGRLETGTLNIDGDLSRFNWTGGELALTATGLSIAGGGTMGRDVTLANDMELWVNGTRLVGADGRLDLRGGRFDGNDELLIDQGGQIVGHGVLASPVFTENSGLVQPEGTLEILGHFIQDDAGELRVTLGPSNRVIVEQTAQLDGQLVVLSSGPDPDTRGEVQEYELLAANDLVGTFDSVFYDGTDLTALAGDPGGSFSVYIGQSTTGEDGLFRSLSYSQETGEAVFANYLALGGDANGDQVVDGQDFVAWNLNKFQTGTDWTTGDFNGDGITDGADFIVWNDNKFTTAVLHPVPEPSAGVLAILGLVFCRRQTWVPCTAGRASENRSLG